MDINLVIDFVTVDHIIQAFAILFALLYLLYAVVLRRETPVMTKTLTTDHSDIFNIIANVQIILAIVMILLAFFLL